MTKTTTFIQDSVNLNNLDPVSKCFQVSGAATAIFYQVPKKYHNVLLSYIISL